MERKISKVLLVLLSVMLIIGISPVQISTTTGQPFAVYAQAAAKKIHLKKTKITLTTGDSYTLSLLDKKDKAISAKKIKWSSSAKKIITVDSNGKIKALKNGTATITAKYKDKKYTCKVTVKNATLSESKKTINVGSAFTLKLKDGAGKAVSADKIAWSTSDKAIATVSKKGKVTAKKAGTAKITATYKGKKYACTVTVKKVTTSSKGDPDNDDAKNGTVYRTPTGKKYHLDPQCGGKNSSAITKSKAVNSSSFLPSVARRDGLVITIFFALVLTPSNNVDVQSNLLKRSLFSYKFN